MYTYNKSNGYRFGDVPVDYRSVWYTEHVEEQIIGVPHKRKKIEKSQVSLYS